MRKNHKEVCVVTVCPFCGKANEVEVNEIDYLDWSDGELAQNAFPYLSADEREMLISGICPKCWDKMFGSADEEEEEDYEEEDEPSFDDLHPDAVDPSIEEEMGWDDDGDWNYNEDMGFDAYEGCYTYDC